MQVVRRHSYTLRKTKEVWECEKVWSLLGSGLNYILLFGQESGRQWKVSIYC